jgi:hypothetical protein
MEVAGVSGTRLLDGFICPKPREDHSESGFLCM